MDLFITTFITLFVVVDPLGDAAVFTGLTADMPKRETRKLAAKATCIAICVLLFFGFVGNIILEHMGITPDAFKIAGGLLLFYTAFKMVMGGHEQTAPEDAKTSSDVAIFPMAIPLMAGPGAAAAFMLMLDNARASEVSLLAPIMAMLAVELMTFVALYMAAEIKALIGRGALSIFARVMGIFLAALSVQFILAGLNL